MERRERPSSDRPLIMLDLVRVFVFLRAVARLAPALLYRRADLGKRARELCEELGITYLKLGQFLATRFDLLPMDVCIELSRLFENVRPLSPAEVRRCIERELSAPLSTHFRAFDERHVGSASVAQVHRAETIDGDVVAIKVQRPGVRDIFEADIRNLRRIARGVDALGLLRHFILLEVIDEFAAFTSREMDQRLEAATAERIAADRVPHVYIPRVFWHLTTQRMLTMEFVDGISLRRVNEMLAAGQHAEVDTLLPDVDMVEVGRRIAFGTLHQLFVTGFFHGDPHPGNILIRRDGLVCLVDFGIFGELTDERRELLSRYIEQLMLGNISEAFRLYTRLLTLSPHTDFEAFRIEATDLLKRYSQAAATPPAGATLQERHLGHFGDELLGLLYKHHIRLDVNTLLFWRTLLMLDATSLPTDNLNLRDTVLEFYLSIRPGFFAQAAAVVNTNRLLQLTAALMPASRARLPVRMKITTQRTRRTRREGTRATITLVLTATSVAAALLVSTATTAAWGVSAWLAVMAFVTLTWRAS